MNHGKGGIDVSASALLTALTSVDRAKWNLEKCKEHLEMLQKRFSGNQQFNILSKNVYKNVRGVNVLDKDLLDYNITPAELMLLNKTSDDELIQEIAKTGSKNLLQLCFAKRMITDTDHCSNYLINVGGVQVVDCLYDVLAWFGCNDILKALFKEDGEGISKYSATRQDGGIYITLSGDCAPLHHAGQRNHYTPIMLAAKAGHIDVVKTLCENITNKEYISSSDSNGDTAKHHAARAGRKDIMDYLEQHDQKQDVNLQNKTPNQLFEDFQKQEAARKAVEFNKMLSKVALCALSVVGVAALYYNRAVIFNMLNFGKGNGLSV